MPENVQLYIRHLQSQIDVQKCVIRVVCETFKKNNRLSKRETMRLRKFVGLNGQIAAYKLARWKIGHENISHKHLQKYKNICKQMFLTRNRIICKNQVFNLDYHFKFDVTLWIGVSSSDRLQGRNKNDERFVMREQKDIRRQWPRWNARNSPTWAEKRSATLGVYFRSPVYTWFVWLNGAWKHRTIDIRTSINCCDECVFFTASSQQLI